MTYEYQCRYCNHTWEQDQKITDEPQKICPACQKETAMRLISRGSFILSGDKWERKNGY